MLSIALISSALAADVFSISLTGAELDAAATNGPFSYGSTDQTDVSGDQLTLSSSSAGNILVRMPVIEADTVTAAQRLEVFMGIDRVTPTADSDISMGVSFADGRHVGAQVGDQNTTWSLDGTDDGLRWTTDDFEPFVNIVRGDQLTVTMGAAQDTTVHVSNGTSGRLLEGVRQVDATQLADVIIGADGQSEQYTLNRITVAVTTVTPVSIALPGMVDSANAAAGGAPVDEAAAASRLRPSVIEGQLDRLVEVLFEGGCTVDTFGVRGAAAGAYGTGFASGSDENGTMIVNKAGSSFEGEFPVEGAFGAFSSVRKNKLVASRDDGGYVAGQFMRTSGRNGVWFAVTGRCVAHVAPQDALQGWIGGDLSGWL